MRGIRRSTVYSLAVPFAGTQTISSAVAAVCPTYPITLSVPVNIGDTLVITSQVTGNAAFGVSEPFLQIYVGGVAQGNYQAIALVNGEDFSTTVACYYTAAATNPALTVDLYCWKAGAFNNWRMYANGGSLQVVRLGT